MDHLTHRDRVDALVDAFLAATPTADGRTAAALAVFAAARGVPVRLVHGRAGDGPDRDWVRVLNVDGIHGYDVDVAAPDAPLVWAMDGAHPTAGVFRDLRVATP